MQEILVDVIMTLCKDARTGVQVGNRYSEEFNISVVVH